MTPDELKEAIAIELEMMETTVQELTALHHDAVMRALTIREKAPAAIFLAQFYNGIENILKRISYFYDIALPAGDTWHIDLFQQFCFPPKSPLPILFDEPLASALAPFRKFRHVVYHSYSLQLDWSRIAGGVAEAAEVFSQFKARLFDYLKTLEMV
jgi:hypothetical protein